MFKSSSKNLKKYITVCIIVAVLILSAAAGVTLAYISGAFNKDDGTTNPFINVQLYYNTNTVVQNDTITGSISNSGVVTLAVNSSTVGSASAGNSVNLPLSLKNTGNIDAELINLMAIFSFYDSSSNQIFSSNTPIKLVSTNAAISAMNTFTLADDTLEVNENVSILDSILIANNIASYTRLLNTTFTIQFVYDAGQSDITQINPHISIGLFNNNTLVENNIINGSISSEGVVSLSIGSTSVGSAGAGESITLPLSLKNIGNLNAEMYNLMAIFTFYDENSNQVILTSAPIQLTSSNATIVANSIFTLNNTTLNAEGSMTVIDLINIADNFETYTSLFNKTFTIQFVYDAGQLSA